MSALHRLDPRSLFREASLKEHLSSEDPKDVLIISPSYSRFGLIYLAIVSAITLFWLFLGALTIEIKGRGIFMNLGGISGIEAQTTGFINKILVQPGDFVLKGTPLIELSDSKQEIRLAFSKEQEEKLREDFNTLKIQIDLEDQKNKEALKKQIEANRSKIENLEKAIPGLEKDYDKKKISSKEGSTDLKAVLDAEKILTQQRAALETAKFTIISLEAKLKKSYRAEELNAIEQRLLEQREQRKILELNKKFNILYSPFDATILESVVNPGDIVTPGKNILWIEPARKNISDMVIYAFVYMEVGKRIPVGQQILIQPENINSQEYGSLIGYVVDISPWMVGNEDIETFIHSKGLINYLTSGAPNPYMITIKPELDPSTPSGFKWTSGRGIPVKISTGTVCLVTGIAFYERPIVRLFPLWRLESLLKSVKEWMNSWLGYEGI